MNYFCGIDPGYGDIKVVIGDAKGVISKIFKFNSIVGLVDDSPLVSDERTLSYKGNSYYVGPIALNLETERIIDVIEYKNLEFFTPLFIESIIAPLLKEEMIPSTIVCGLSIAHIEQSGYFRNAILEHLVQHLKIPCDVKVIPQGIGGKIAFDKYGISFPDENKEFSIYQNYIGVDVGFNTLDIFQVIQGKTTPNHIRGIENEGVIKIARLLATFIKDTYGITFSLKECKSILDEEFFKVRGQIFNLSTVIHDLKRQYVLDMQQLVEKEFGNILNKADKMRLFGGGAYMFKSITDTFIEVPREKSEYYNAIGNYLHSLRG